jgi:superfamily II DNA or RNA helicase
MKIEGEIVIKGDYIYIDAVPSVMTRIRSMFKNLSYSHQRGKYTKNTIKIPKNNLNAKDIIWLCMRYKFEAQSEQVDELKKMTAEYDALAAKILDIYNKDASTYEPENSLELVGKTPRDYQTQFYNIFNQIHRVLNTDEMGMGKTLQALMVLAQAEHRPALLVMPTHLIIQWKRVIEAVLPDAKVQEVKTGNADFKIKDNIDFFITTYDKMKKMPATYTDPKLNLKMIVGDEIHHIRNIDTERRSSFKQISKALPYSLGLTGSPVFNAGKDLYSIVDALNPGVLGNEKDFVSEWCEYSHTSGKYEVSNPEVLFDFLLEQGFMVRRMRKQYGHYFNKVQPTYIPIEASLDELKEVSDVLKALALGSLSLDAESAAQSAREFDIKLRKATGIAKAKPVAELVKSLIEEKGKVIVSGWHRDFWDILKKELRFHNPVMVTGSESPREKDKSIEAFCKGNSDVLFISHKSGEGIDGLQFYCSTIVHGELAWNIMTHEQLDMRIDREGQEKIVDVIYPYIQDGSDPMVLNLHNIKKEISYKLTGMADELENNSHTEQSPIVDYIKNIAREYLEKNNIEVVERLKASEEEQEILDILDKVGFAGSNEMELQDNIMVKFNEIENNFLVEKEFKFSARSRLDFKLTHKTSGNVYVIECKSNAKNRAEGKRQIDRYIDEVKPTAVIVVAPWTGVKDFMSNGVKVFVSNYVV